MRKNMNKIKRNYTVWGLIFVLLIACSPAFAWQVNEHYTNNTGQTAHDLTKILMGDIYCTDTMLNQPFADFTRLGFGAFTFFHWYTGTVAPGEQGHACFSTSSPVVPPCAAYWTDAAGNFIGPAGPVMVPSVGFNPNTGEALFKIGNEWQQWTGTGYPPQPGDGLGPYVGDVLVSSAYYALDSVQHPIEDLDSATLANLGWQPLGELEGRNIPGGDAVEQPVQFNPVDITPKTQVLFMFFVEGGGQEAYNVIQRSAYRERVPSMTNYGLGVIVLLLILSTIFVYYRRRKATA